MSYCTICGDSGIEPETGNICICKSGSLLEFDKSTITCFTIPEQYKGVMFNPILVRSDLIGDYANYLNRIYQEIYTFTFKPRNIFIYSPVKSSKTIFAYSCIEQLFRADASIFPIFDVLEIRSMIRDLDASRPIKYLETMELQEMSLFTCKVLFVKAGNEFTGIVYDTLATLIDRRVRRNNATIILSNYNWNFYTANDTKESFCKLKGDGSYGSILVKHFYKKGGDTNSEK